MMEVPPCPPGHTSLPLSTATTAAAADRTELSPDSGNGEDLDEFDPLKSPPRYSDEKCEIDKVKYKLLGPVGCLPAVGEGCGNTQLWEDFPSSVGFDRLKGSGGRLSPCGGCKQNGQVEWLPVNADNQKANMITYVTEKPGVFRLSLQPEGRMESREEMQITAPPGLTGGLERPHRSRAEQQQQQQHYSPAFNLKTLESSLLASCGPSFPCGPFSTSCGSVGKPSSETNGPFSLPDGHNSLLHANTSSVPFLLEGDNLSSVKPFSMQTSDDVGLCKATLSSCDISYTVSATQPSTFWNPGYSSSSRGSPARRHTNPEVVRTQPTSGGLLTTSCDLMTSPPGQCACVNPGTSHACAPRLSQRSSLGVLNPLFEHDSCNTHVTYTSMPLSPKKFSLDLDSKSKSFDLPELPKTPVMSVNPPYHHEPPGITKSLPCSLQEHYQRDTNPFSSCGQSLMPPHLPPPATSPSANLPFQLQDPGRRSPSAALFANVESLSHRPKSPSAQRPSDLESLVSRDAPGDLADLRTMPEATSTAEKYTKPLVTSPDWFSFLTPIQDGGTYTQKLLTPGDLHDELLYPPPYGMNSEVYQNINAREAEFVLQKPNRKPRTEPLPSCPITSSQRPVSPGPQSGIIEPLATEDEEALWEGAWESRKASLSERRKSSLEKLYIPKPGDPPEVLLNVKIDNFDRDEYVEYKKRFGETDTLIAECLRTATKRPLLGSHVLPTDNNPVALDIPKLSQKGDDVRKVVPSTSLPEEKLNMDIFPDKSEEKEKLKQKTSVGQPKHSQRGAVAADDRPPPPLPSTDPTANLSSTQEKQRNKETLRQKDLLIPRQLSPQRDDFSPQRTTRKQSLPTEELFGNRRARLPRKLSLNPLSDSLLLGNGSSKTAFSPVRETEEPNFCLHEESVGRKAADRKKSPYAKCPEDLFDSTNSSKEKSGGRSKTRNRSQMESKGLSSAAKLGSAAGRQPVHKERNKSDEHNKSSRLKETVSKSLQQQHHHQHPHQHHEHHHQHQEHHHQYYEHHHHQEHHHQHQEHHHHQEHHQRHPSRGATSHDPWTSGHHSIGPEKGPTLPTDKDKKRKDSSRRSPRKSPKKTRRPAKESHTNLGALLSPPGLESPGDLFTSKESIPDGKRPSLRNPLVPYEPLVDVLTPTTPEGPNANTGATR